MAISSNSLTPTLIGNKIEFPIRLGIAKMASISIVIGPLIFLGITVILESTHLGYDRISDTISKLVWSQNGWLQTAGFYLFAIVLAMLAIILRHIGISRRNLRATILPIYLMSTGFFIIAVIPTNAPGEPATLTVFIHRFVAGVVCFLFPIVCLSLARGLKGDSNFKRLRIFSLIAGGIGFILSIAGILVIMSEIPWKGAIERIILANGILWIEVIGIRIMLILHTINLGKKKITVIPENHIYKQDKYKLGDIREIKT